MARFMLLFHHQIGPLAPSGDSHRVRLEEFIDWASRLGADGRMLAGEKLTEEPGRNLQSSGGAVQVMDGPFAETKELTGGFIVIEAQDYDDAVAVAMGCPLLDHRGRVEVRQVDDRHH